MGQPPPRALPFVALLAVLPLWAAAAVLTPGSAGPGDLPPALDYYARTVAHLSSGEMRSLAAGSPVSKLLDTGTPHEVAVFGAVWIAASSQQYVEAVNDIERFERGAGFLKTRRISNPPRLDDFAELELPDDDIKELRRCRLGHCAVKLSQAALQQLRKEIDWSSPTARDAVNTFMRRLSHEFVTGYLEAGNERLSVYRDSDRPTFVAAEFKSMIGALPEFVDHVPELRRYLLEFPNVSLGGETSFLYWQMVDIGLKPTLRINHVVIHPHGRGTIVATKMLYASHYFWTALELRALIPDPARGKGFWFASVSRSRSDGLTGFTGLFARNRVRSSAKDGLLKVLRATKRRLEEGHAASGPAETTARMAEGKW
jgi:hypothetical protein